MLNLLWPLFIIVSFSFAIISGNIDKLNKSILNSTNDAINLSISILGTMCLWNGIVNIANNTKIINIINRLLNPIIKLLFPDLKNNTKIQNEISMNMVANFLGLGNAATPLGLKAMKSMQKENKKKNHLSDSMMMFIVINTASIQIIPTTVLAIRTSLNSKNPSEIILPVWIATIVAAIGRYFSHKNYY